jgi:hypothetical protein
MWQAQTVTIAANAVVELLERRDPHRFSNGQRKGNVSRFKKVLCGKANYVKGYTTTLSRCSADVQENQERAWVKATTQWTAAPQKIQAANAHDAIATWVLYPSARALVESFRKKIPSVECDISSVHRLCRNSSLEPRAHHLGFVFARHGASEASKRKQFKRAQEALNCC